MIEEISEEFKPKINIDLDEFQFESSKDLMEIALTELIENASKFGSDIHTSSIRGIQKDDRYTIEIENFG